MDFERGDATVFVIDLNDAELRGRWRAGGDDDFVGDDLVQDDVVVQGEAVGGRVGGRGEFEFGEDLLEDAGLGLFGSLDLGVEDFDGPGLSGGGLRLDMAGEIGAEGVARDVVAEGEFEFAEGNVEGEGDVAVLNIEEGERCGLLMGEQREAKGKEEWTHRLALFH